VPGYSLWTCDSGAGTGTLAYQRSSRDPAIRIPIKLVVVGDTVAVDGTYVQRSTGREITVRARFPAVCSWVTQVHGYEGTVTPT
jgi:hypothetical protein